MADVNTTVAEVASTSGWLNPVVVNVLIAFVFLFLGFILARLISNLVKRLLRLARIDEFILSTIKIPVKIESVIVGLISLGIAVGSVLLALNQVGLLSILLHVVGYVIVIIVLIALILGFKDIMPNIIAGFFVRIRLRHRKGHSIKTGSVRGKLVSFGLADMVIQTDHGDTLLVPYAVFMKEKTIASKE